MVLVSSASAAMACSETVTDMSDATVTGLPVVEQQVVASSLPLLPFSGRTARVTVRAWGDLGEIQVPTRLGFGLLTFIGCRSPIEGWIGDREVFQVYDIGGPVELIQLVDVPDGLSSAQAQALTASLGPPVVTQPSAWDYATATAWAWWPHLALLAGLVGVFVVLRALALVVIRSVRGRRHPQTGV